MPDDLKVKVAALTHSIAMNIYLAYYNEYIFSLKKFMNKKRQ